MNTFARLYPEKLVDIDKYYIMQYCQIQVLNQKREQLGKRNAKMTVFDFICS